MDTLVVCRCTHTIKTHENGGCSAVGCACKLASYHVLDEEIDRLKKEHAVRAKPVIAAGRG